MNPRKKIKICFVSLSAYPLFNPKCKATFGGAEVQLYLLSKYLAKDSLFDVHFIVGDFEQENMEEYEGVKVHKIHNGKYNIGKLLSLLKLLWQVKAEVYIQRSASMGTGLICALVHLMCKKFIYMTAHDIDCNGDFEKQKKWISGRIFRYGIRKADIVITQSERHKRLIAKHHKRDSQVLPSFYEIPPNFTSSKRDFILWVARCERWKRPEIFIDLAEKFPDEQFVMICPKANHDPRYYVDVKQQAEKLSNLKFVDFIPFQEMDSYFARAKVFVQTSLHEGFPNTFIQAAKNAVPILSLNVDPDNFLQKNDCGLFADNNIEKLISHLNLLLKNRKLCTSLGDNAYRYVKKKHDIRAIAETYKAILKELTIF